MRDLRGETLQAAVPLRVANSREKLYGFIDVIAKEIDRPGVSATINPTGYSLNVTASHEGSPCRSGFSQRGFCASCETRRPRTSR